MYLKVLLVVKISMLSNVNAKIYFQLVRNYQIKAEPIQLAKKIGHLCLIFLTDYLKLL